MVALFGRSEMRKHRDKLDEVIVTVWIFIVVMVIFRILAG